MSITIRYAAEQDLPAVNTLRAMVNKLHVQGRPDIFRPGFCQELQDFLYAQFTDPGSDVIVADLDGTICGFATVAYIHRPESPYNLARSYYHVEEFGVSPDHRRMGIATALVDFMKREAAAKGLPRIELDAWEFNQSAMSFYEAAGFKPYRRFMELEVEPD